MLSSLDDAYSFVRDTPRNRSPKEAHWKLNRAYFDLIFAWGYAQSGNELRAEELLQQSRAALPHFDPVHQTALRAFELRIRERNVSPWTRLEIDLAGLDSLHRYKLMRLFETLAILSRVESQNAIGHFWRENRSAGGAVPLHEDLVTQVLIADGEGRVEDVRGGLEAVFSSAWVNGTVLIGPCRRAGREAQLLNMVKQRPPDEAAVALEALGAVEPGELQFERLGEFVTQRVVAARKHIGALALCGRMAAASALAADAWRAATDTFNTNSAFTITALGVCETIVLSVLRHELAPGNRSLLEPIDPSLEQRSVQTEASAPAPEWLEQILGEHLAKLESALRDVAVLPGSFQERFRVQHEQVRSFLSQRGLPSGEEPEMAVLTLSERVERVKTLASHAEMLMCDGECESESPEFVRAASPLFLGASALVEAFEHRDPEALRARNGLIGALHSVDGCLRSLVVERPAMSKSQLERIGTAREPLGRVLARASDDPYRSRDGRWVELPYEELVARIASCLEDAKRELMSIPEEWEPGLTASAREAITQATALLPDLTSTL